MTVVDIIEMRRRSLFGAALRQRIAAKFRTLGDFQRVVFGVDAKGKPKGSGQLFGVLQGGSAPSPSQAAAWAAALDMSPEEWQIMAREAESEAQEDGQPRPERRGPGRPAKGAALPETDQLALTIGADGLASLRLSVSGLPLEKALALMASLTSAGVLRSAAIAHERAED